jgi:hypothetical protein
VAQLSGKMREQGWGSINHHNGIIVCDFHVAEADTPERANTIAVETIDAELDVLGIVSGERAWSRQPIVTEA